MLFTALLGACTDTDIDFPDRNSMGMSKPLIEINAPSGDTPLPADTPFTLDYAILRSQGGHHVKIRIDKRRPETVVRLSGKHQLPGLPAGKHKIRITEYTKDGLETGGDITITVTMLNQAPAAAEDAAVKATPDTTP